MIDLLLQDAHLCEQGVEVCIWLSHLRRNLVESVEHGLGFFNRELDVSENSKALVKRRLLKQDSNGGIGGETCFTVAWSIDSGHDLEHGGFTCTVWPDNADFGSRNEGQSYVIKNDLVAMRFARLDHLIDEFSQSSCRFQ